MKKRIQMLSLLLATSMIFTTVPAYAAENGELSEENNLEAVAEPTTEAAESEAGELQMDLTAEEEEQSLPVEMTSEAAESTGQTAAETQNGEAEVSGDSGKENKELPAGTANEAETKAVVTVGRDKEALPKTEEEAEPLLAFASAVPVDNSTTLADGEYTLASDSNFTFTVGSGRARFSVDKIIVSGGKASAVIRDSKSYTHLFLGSLSQGEGDQAVFNDGAQATSPKLEGVYAFGADKTVTIPVDLNADMTVSGRTAAMSSAAWINYVFHITMDENAKPAENPDEEPGKNPSEEPEKDPTGNQQEDKPEDSSQELTITSNAAMFKIVDASLEVKDGKKYARVALGGTGYRYLYRGSMEEASTSKWSERIKGELNKDGKWEFLIPVTDEDGTFEIAALSYSHKSWYKRSLTLDQDKLTIASASASVGSYDPVDDHASPETDPVTPSEGGKTSGTGGASSGTGSNTGSQTQNGGQQGQNSGNNQNQDGAEADDDRAEKAGTSGSAAVGEYSFSWSGGTGRTNITCSSVTKRGDQYYATITFAGVGGRASHYGQVRVGGQTFAGSNTFEIPVTLNTNMSIEAMTTAMSAAHWITYVIRISSKEAGGGAIESTVAKQTKAMDEEAPEITGLTFQEETGLDYTDKVKIFNYDQGITLIEVNMVKGTSREDLNKEQAEEAGTKSAEGTEDSGEETSKAAVSGADEDKAAEQAAEAAEKTVQLYLNNVVKYLVVPEDTEVPVGLDKETIIIRQPADKTYISSESALSMMEKLGVLDNIASVGIETQELDPDSIRKAVEDGEILAAGSYDDWDLKTLIKAGTNLAIESSEILPDKDADEEETDQAVSLLKKYASRSVQMDMPVFVDRSADEVNELAAAEWYKVYGIIYGQAELGDKLYKEIVSKASEADKQEALAEVNRK